MNIEDLMKEINQKIKDVKCYNPSFDVTDHELLTAIVTEKGIVYPPFDKNLKELFSK